VLTYLVVAALVIGTPLATAISTTAVRGEQRQTIYYTDYDSSTNDWRVCDEPERRTEDGGHTNRIWWMLAPNPFAALADSSARHRVQPEKNPWTESSPLEQAGLGIDEMRNPQPDEVVIYYCSNEGNHHGDNMPNSDDTRRATHLVFWPVSLVVVFALGAWSLTCASRRLRASPAQIRSAPSQLGLEVAPLQPHLPLGHRQPEARAAVLGRIDLRGVEAVAASDGLMVQPPQVAAHNRHRVR